MKRVASAAAVAAGTVALCFAAPAPVRGLFVLLAALGACREAVRLAGAAFSASAVAGSVGAALVLLIAATGAPAPFPRIAPDAAAVLGLGLLGLFALVLPKTANGLGRLGALALVGCWIGLPTAALLDLGAGEAGGRTLFFLLATVMIGEAGAFLSGRLIGGPRLAPLLSPGKTWAGFVGQLLVSAATAAVAAPLLAAPPPAAAALGVWLAGAAALGDLFASYWKRASGRKDAGRLIPGHGGVLDRVDGILFAALAFAAARPFLPGG